MYGDNDHKHCVRHLNEDFEIFLVGQQMSQIPRLCEIIHESLIVLQESALSVLYILNFRGTKL